MPFDQVRRAWSHPEWVRGILLAGLFVLGCSPLQSNQTLRGLLFQTPGPPGNPVAPPQPGFVTQFPIGPDLGIRAERSLADHDFNSGDQDFRNNVVGSTGQPSFSWDGKLRFAPNCGYYGVSHPLAGRWFCGLTALIVDFDRMSIHSNGKIEFAYTTGNPYFPKGAPLFKNLMRGRAGTGTCAGEFQYEINNSVCGNTQWDIALDGSQFPAAGVDPLTGVNANLSNPTTLFAYMWHAQVLPNPDSPHQENPYLSDAAGNAASGITNFMTYDVLLMASVVGTPQSYDLDAGRPGRERIGFVLGKVVTEFTVTEGNHRFPTRIISAELDKASFAIARTSLTQQLVVRGIEPTMDRFGQLLITNFSFFTPNLNPASGSPLTGHAALYRRTQGKFRDPYCTRGTPGCVPLLFTGPNSIAGLHQFANTTIPGSDLKYGQQYLLARYPMASPLGDRIYGANDYYGSSYPWIGLDGGEFFSTTSVGGGRYLDRDGPAAIIQKEGGMEYCLRGESCIGGTPFSPAPANIGGVIMREATSVVGPLETVINGQRVFQVQPLDSKLNEAPRTLARVTSWSSGFWSSLWGFEARLPTRWAAKYKSSPGPFAMPTFIFMNNWAFNNSVGYIGREENTAHGQPIPGTQFQGYLFYSPLQMTGNWLPDNRPNINSLPAPNFANPERYTRHGTMILTDVTRAQDVSGNNLKVQLNYTDAQGGVFFPPNDPVNDYPAPLYDNARQNYLFGRFGNGVGCSSDGMIAITEEPGVSRPGSLSSYTDTLSVHFWMKPVGTLSSAVLARSPAYTVSMTAGGQIAVQVRTNVGPVNYATSNSVVANAWSHVLVEMAVDAAQNRLNTKIVVNGSEALTALSNATAGMTALAANDGSAWHFCPGGASTANNHVLNMDEIAITSRKLTAQEIRVAALLPDPELAPSITTQSQAALLGPLSSVISFFGYDPKSAFVPVDNPVTQAKIDLGKKLFFDPRLSSTQQVSCASCHVPAAGYGTPHPSGLGFGVNNQPSSRAPNRIVNLIFARPESLLNWDGRARSLEAQIVGPLIDSREMALGSLQEVENRARTFGGTSATGYEELALTAFGISMSQITELQVRKALATFVRSLIVGDAPYDRYLRGDASALTAQQRLGFGIFTMNCVGCHNGAALTNHQFASIGLFPDTHSDQGRGAITRNPAEIRTFKTPGLRDLNLREGRGFGHDGSIQTLATVVSNYRSGGTHITQNIHHDIHAIPLSSTDQTALEDFLRNGLRSSTAGSTIYTFTAP